MCVTCANCGDSRAVIGQEIDGVPGPRAEQPARDMRHLECFQSRVLSCACVCTVAAVGAGILSSEKLSWDHSASEDYERFRVRCDFPAEATVIRETWDEYVLEYCHRVKDFARFTRSIGDVQLKDPDCARKFNSLQSKVQVLPLPEPKPYILNTPQVHFHQLHRQDKFIIVASDGLWDEMSSDQAVFAVGHFIQQHGKQADIAALLLEYCLAQVAKRLAAEEPELEISNVGSVKALPKGKGGCRGLMDDQARGGSIKQTHRHAWPLFALQPQDPLRRLRAGGRGADNCGDNPGRGQHEVRSVSHALIQPCPNHSSNR
jgi:hypothetical protein